MFTAFNTESLPWIQQLGDNINKPASLSFTGTLIPGGVLKVVNVSNAAMGGGLVTCKTAIPADQNIAANEYFGMDLDVYVPVAEMAKLARLELDIKRVVVDAKGSIIANVGNGSTQLNCQNGQWQIDKAGGGWVDTGFEPLLPSTWTALSFRHKMTATEYSVLSTTWGGMKFDLPASMQNLVLETSNWGAVVAVQIQTEIIAPGTVTIYCRNINVSVSPTAF